jgi:uncharacterized protein (TIGR01244 family)
MRSSTRSLLIIVAAGAWLSAGSAYAQEVTKEEVAGVVNFARIDTTVACAGAIKPEAIAELKQRGYKAIINLQAPEERDADVAGETAAAEAAGINYVHVPLSLTATDPTAVDRFLAAVTDPANQPAFIHCTLGIRASGLWAVKRVLVDKWDVDRAMTEAEALSTTSPMMKKFVLAYLQDHQK